MKLFVYEVKFKEVYSVIANVKANSKREAKEILMNTFVQHYNDSPLNRKPKPEMGKKYNDNIETWKDEGNYFGEIVNKKDFCFLDERKIK